jgi:hypothetical protein
LPSAERPLRLAEFDQLFATSLRGLQRLAATRLRLILDSDSASVARDLTARESECCSFFTFTLTAVADELQIDIEVSAGHADVLNALAMRAAAHAGALA